MHSQDCKPSVGVRLILLTQYFQIAIPEACKYVTLEGKRYFADMIKLRLLIQDYFGNSGWAQSNRKSPYKEGRQENHSQSE